MRPQQALNFKGVHGSLLLYNIWYIVSVRVLDELIIYRKNL